MDFSKLDTSKKANEGAFLHFTHPGTGAKLYDELEGGGRDLNKPVGIFLLGKDSDAHAQYLHKRTNDRIFAKDDVQNSSEESEAETIKMISELATGWKNIDLGGGRTDFSKSATVELFTHWKWAIEQAIAFVTNRANFI